MKHRNYHIILRYQIDPDWESVARQEELVDFCLRAGVGEVMLLILAEELSTGHPTAVEWDEWIALCRELRQRLETRGIGLSLNPWVTTYQVARGRRLRDGQSFRQMVGETGEPNGVTACPLCLNWQKYLSESFARLAREVRPVAIWVEDDWRLHNHGPTLGWGGCFCEEHMRRFSEMAGRPVAREELRDALLQPGVPHPWRALWLDLSRQTMLEPMHALFDAVHRANPECQLGLMTSRPDQHSVEGRDWEAMGKAVSGSRPFLIRPHMEPYTEERALRTTASVTRHTLACLSGPLACYPELENSPRCGIYSKSGRHTVWQMLEAAVLGSPGITINHFDNTGSGISLDPGFASHLSRARPVLDALATLGMDDRRADGVQVLFSPEVACHLQLSEQAGGARGGIDIKALSRQMQLNPSGAGGAGFAGSMQSLVHPSLLWGETCAILGIAHRFTREIDPQGGPILVNGQTLRAFNDETIRRLLSGFCVLDAAAALVLQERGFGDYLGVHYNGVCGVNEGPIAYEQIFEEDPHVYGVSSPRVTAQRIADVFHIMQPCDHAIVRAALFSPSRQKLMPSTVDFCNDLGGRVVTLAYALDGGAQFFMGYFNVFRRLFWQNLFLDQPGGARLAVGPDGTRVYRVDTSAGTLVSVLNASLDSLSNIVVRVSDGEQVGASRWQVLRDDGKWDAIIPEVQGEELRFPHPLAHLSGAFLLAGPQ